MLELPRRDHQKGIPLHARFNSRGLCLTHTMKITHSLRSHHKRSRQIAVIVLQRQGDMVTLAQTRVRKQRSSFRQGPVNSARAPALETLFVKFF